MYWNVHRKEEHKNKNVRDDDGIIHRGAVEWTPVQDKDGIPTTIHIIIIRARDFQSDRRARHGTPRVRAGCGILGGDASGGRGDRARRIIDQGPGQRVLVHVELHRHRLVDTPVTRGKCQDGRIERDRNISRRSAQGRGNRHGVRRGRRQTDLEGHRGEAVLQNKDGLVDDKHLLGQEGGPQNLIVRRQVANRREFGGQGGREFGHEIVETEGVDLRPHPRSLGYNIGYYIRRLFWYL